MLINHDIGKFDARSMVYIVVLTLLTGVVAHGLIVFAQRKVPIGIMSMMQVGQPALAVVWSAIFLESVDPRCADPRDGHGGDRSRHRRRADPATLG